MHTSWLQWLRLTVVASLLLAESSAHVLGRPGGSGGRHLRAARMGTVRRNQRLKARREAARRRVSEEEGIAAIDARENAPKDTTHSAVKAIKYRLAKARKSPAADLEDEDDAEMEAEGSERQLQARGDAADEAVLSQRNAISESEGRAEDHMTPTEELEQDVTGVLDNDKEQEALSSGLRIESKAAPFMQRHDVPSKVGQSDDAEVEDVRLDLTSGEHSHHSAPGALHQSGPAQEDDDDIEPEPEPDLESDHEQGRALPQYIKVSPGLADRKDPPREAVANGQKAAAAKKGQEMVKSVPQPKQKSEGGQMPAVKKLPPWFRESFRPDSPEKPKTRMGSGRAHASRVLSYEEKWLHAHQRHLSLAADGWDVILFGDDLVEAWRGTFLGQAYGPFSEIPAVWDTTFGAQSYTALAAGIAGDGVEQVKWRLENGELPALVPPKVIVLAVGSNSKGMAGECRVDLAEETANEMSALLYELREALPQTQLVLMAPLPKGEYWPNRCTPAFRVFSRALQDFATDHPEHVHFMDLSASFLVRPASEIWANATDTARQEINETFMPDAQHPSAPGMRIVAAALEPLVRRLVSAAPDDMDAI